MIEDSTIIKIKNRDNGTVGYTIPDMNNLHRSFRSGETKKVTMEELRKLSWIPGGSEILANFLVILDNQEAVEELLGTVEPEYNYTETEVTYILQEGTLGQLQDCLNFAPKGVIELVKDLAVTLEVNDIQKRDLILQKTGFNVTKAIEINHEDAKPEETEERQGEPVVTEKKETVVEGRTSAPVTVTGSKYKVTSIQK